MYFSITQSMNSPTEKSSSKCALRWPRNRTGLKSSFVWEDSHIHASSSGPRGAENLSATAMSRQGHAAWTPIHSRFVNAVSSDSSSICSLATCFIDTGVIGSLLISFSALASSHRSDISVLSGVSGVRPRSVLINSIIRSHTTSARACCLNSSSDELASSVSFRYASQLTSAASVAYRK